MRAWLTSVLRPGMQHACQANGIISTMRTTIDKAGRWLSRRGPGPRPLLARDRARGHRRRDSAFAWSVSRRARDSSRSAGASWRAPRRTPIRGPGSTSRRWSRSATGGRDRVPRHERAARGADRLRPQSAPAQSVMHAVAQNTVRGAATAWHCCLEFFSSPRGASRVPPHASRCDAPAGCGGSRADRGLRPSVRRSAQVSESGVRGWDRGGRIYDAHIADIARAAGAPVVVTDNRRHFMAALRHGLRIETPAEFLTAMSRKKDTNS